MSVLAVRTGLVLVVHRSAVSREILRVTLAALDDVRVLAAPSAELARARAARERPDAVVLPLHGSEPAIQALIPELEAAGVPVIDAGAKDLLALVKRAVRIGAGGPARAAGIGGVAASAVVPATRTVRPMARLIVLGASTGGTEALRRIIGEMPSDAPPILAVQHMPAGYTRSFAERLGRLSQVNVREAVDGDRLVPGQAFIAPGGLHARVMREGTDLVVRLEESPHINGHRPSVDVLFKSVAEVLPPGTAAGLLTGMGADGANGLVALKEAGAFTVAQDEATSVVFGMPKEGIERGGACRVLPLERVSGALLGLGD